VLDLESPSFSPLGDLAETVRRGILAREADQHRPGHPYLKNPPLTTREREWLDRASLCLRLLEVVDQADSLDLISPTLSPVLVALRAIVADAERAASPRV
jgi:hypothetical protein